MHIAIIGAGISGLLSALELVEQGCSISIFDQQQAAQAASWAGSGILSPMYPWRFPVTIKFVKKTVWLNLCHSCAIVILFTLLRQPFKF